MANDMLPNVDATTAGTLARLVIALVQQPFEEHDRHRLSRFSN